MPLARNHKKIANPLDMEIFESDDYASFGWDNLRPNIDQLWPLKKYKKYITGPHIVRLWYFDDMDAMQYWLAHWKFCMTSYTISKFAICYDEMIMWIRATNDVLIASYNSVCRGDAKDACEMDLDDCT